MMKDPNHPNEEAPGNLENPGTKQQAGRPSGQDRQEQYRRAREQAPTNELGTPRDREARIDRRARELWEREGKPEGFAEQHWERAAQEIDREDAKILRDMAREQPDAEPQTKNPGSDRT
jgi:hypothetical protein